MIVMIMIKCNDHDDCLAIGVKYHNSVDIDHDHNDFDECYDHDYVMIMIKCNDHDHNDSVRNPLLPRWVGQ